MIKPIPKFNGLDLVGWTRSYNDILQISWPFLSKIIFESERLEPTSRSGSREEGVENPSDFDGNDSDRSKVSDHNMDNFDGRRH